MNGFEFVETTWKHNSNVAAMFWSPWAQFDASDRRFNPADIFWVFFFFFLLLCPLGQNIIPIWNESKWNTIMLMIAIPTAKFMFVCQWGGALKRQKIKSLYITRKRKKSQHSSTNRLYIHTQVVVSLTLCPNHCYFFFSRGHRRTKRWLEIQQPTIRSLANCHLSFHICSVQDILPFQMKKYFLSILCTAYCSNASDW